MNVWILLFGMFGIAAVLLLLSRTLCRDPELTQVDLERERTQRALAEAVVRNMDTNELVAIASGRLRASALLTAAAERSRDRSSRSSESEDNRGINQVTRLSFVKMSAGRRGSPPILEPVLPQQCQPDTIEVANAANADGNSAEGPLSAAADGKEEKSRSSANNSSSVSTSSEDKASVSSPGNSLQRQYAVPLAALPRAASKTLPRVSSDSSSTASAITPRAITPRVKRPLGARTPGGSAKGFPEFGKASSSGGEDGDGGVADGRGKPGEVVEVVPGAVYSDDSCSVCLDDYEEGQPLLQLTCGHVYHRACINLWLKAHSKCPCCRTDLDKLAQLEQVFPHKNRRMLQRALTLAEGNAVVAVDLLFSPRNPRHADDIGLRDANNINHRDGVRLGAEAARTRQIIAAAGVDGVATGVGDISQMNAGNNTLSILDMSASRNPHPATDADDAADTHRGASSNPATSTPFGRVTTSLSARFRRSSSGRWYNRSESAVVVGAGSGDTHGRNVGTTRTRRLHRSRSGGTRRSRAVVHHEASIDEDYFEDDSPIAEQTENRRHRQRRAESPENARSTDDHHAHGNPDTMNADIELGRFEGVRAGAAGAAAGAAAAATAAAVVAEARAERERWRPPERPASYSASESSFESNRTLSVGEGNAIAGLAGERATSLPRHLRYSGFEEAATAAVWQRPRAAAETVSTKYRAARSSSFPTKTTWSWGGDGRGTSPGFVTQATGESDASLSATQSEAVIAGPSDRRAPSHTVTETMLRNSQRSLATGDAGASPPGVNTPARRRAWSGDTRGTSSGLNTPARTIGSSANSTAGSSPSLFGLCISATPCESEEEDESVSSLGDSVDSPFDRPPCMLERLESSVTNS